ncbi:glycine cleavage system aminomethyltransferase GcvT [Blattabacterium cuenoti]|uniref:glycine cleavage system aminomethyltransferase GcvT n=1 Tax=Blattabacterium cuenoti TaxID=1653831 RepID=UPI00163C69BC|nr:glycine cleavage system aminomethyltransferase GcvT [Blattabacterium cuenoti]
MNIKRTTLYKNHVDLNAKMINYSGFYMPLQYSSSIKEHIYVRNYSGIFDVSHMGKFIIQGSNANNVIQYLTTNDIFKLKIGEAQYNCMINDNGGIIDDLVIFRLKTNKLLLIVNAVNIEKNKNWIKKYIKKNGTELIDISQEYSLLSIQGPLSLYNIKKLTSIQLEKIPFYKFEIGELCGIKNVIISNTGYTGSIGFEIFVHNKYVDIIWNEILNIGKEKIVPCGLSSRDSLRLEMGYRLYGNDISEKTTPIESGLSWIVKFKKQFISKKILIKQKEIGTYKRLSSFYLEKNINIIPRKGNILVDDNNKIGYVTSGNYSPILKQCIGLCYLTKENKNNKIYLITRNKKIPIFKKKLPFIIINK